MPAPVAAVAAPLDVAGGGHGALGGGHDAGSGGHGALGAGDTARWAGDAARWAGDTARWAGDTTPGCDRAARQIAPPVPRGIARMGQNGGGEFIPNGAEQSCGDYPMTHERGRPEWPGGPFPR